MTRIEFLRRKMNVTQKQLASIVGDWPCNIAQVERGHRKPWPRIRKAIAEALGVGESDLFDSSGVPLTVDWELPRSTKDVS